MAGTILQITKTPQVLTISSAKTVKGNFGVQLWCKVIDASGEEQTLYLPWANRDGTMSGAVQQLIKTGVMGPEDWTSDVDQWYDQLKDNTFTFSKVYKDDKQFINIDRATSTLGAAVKELGLDPQPVPVAASAPRAAQAPVAHTQPRATVESINALYDKAVAHALNVTSQIAEQGFEVSGETVHAMAATLLIAYQKEGVK